MDRSSNKLTAVVVSLAVGAIIGGGIGYAGASDMNKNKDTTAMTSSSPSMSGMSEDGVTVGGAKMVATKDIVDNAAAASNVKTVVSLVKMAGLVDTLKSPGPFTVFGPNDGAFGKIDADTLASLQKSENVGTLKTILTYHVIPGTYTSADLRVMAAKGESLTSVQGAKVTPMVENNKLMLMDAKGNKIGIETADIISSNGVTHVVDSVMMPQ